MSIGMSDQHFFMAANYLIKLISGKWKVPIICTLEVSPLRYKKLQKRIQEYLHVPISQKVLTEQLNQLVHSGIVIRKSYEAVPPKVIYSLSNIGQEIANQIRFLNVLGEKLANQNTDDVSFDLSAKSAFFLHSKDVLRNQNSHNQN